MEVIKIGGAVLKSKEGFEQFVNIIQNEHPKPLLVIISAFSSATRDLTKAARIAETCNGSEARAIVENIIITHKNYAKQLFSDNDKLKILFDVIDRNMIKLFDFIGSISITGELTPRIQDAVLSFGELLALIIIDKYLEVKNIKHKCIDSTSIIVSDNNFQNAQPIIKETEENVNKFLVPELNDNQIIITQGFIARSTTGDITTMGMESSNLTATLLACILKADKLTLWTDVEGIRTADPKLIQETKLIKNLSYSDAYSSAVNGLKLIYPGMIDIAKENNLKLIYKSAFNPDGEFSIINSKKSSEFPIINFQQNLKFIKINNCSKSKYNNLKTIIDNLLTERNDIIEINYKKDFINLIVTNRINLREIIKNFDCEIIENCTQISASNLNHQQIKEFYIFTSDKIPDLKSAYQSGNSFKFVVKEKINVKMIEELHKLLFTHVIQ